MSSSPDPLSFVTSSPSKSAAMRRSAKRATPQPLARLSPNVQRSDPFLEIPDLGHVSPSKSITMTTPRAAGSSPWRIKVTVEAQPHDEYSQDENSLTSPTGARAARIATQTTTIPLNDANGSSPLKRRGRPRKSDTLPATQTTTIQLNDANGSSPTKKRGRPRKSDTTPAIATQTTTVPLNDVNGSSPVKRNGRVKKGTPVRKPRKSITRSPEDSEVNSSLSDASYHPSMRAPVRTRRSLSKDVNVPEPIRAAAMYGPRSPEQLQEEAEDEQPITSSSSIGQRRRSARASSGVGDIASDTVFKQMEDNEQTPKASSSRHVGNDEDMWKSMISHHEYESDPTAEEESNSSDDELDIVMPDQTIGETTMLHSEEFSMVSLDSLPSMKIAQNGTSPPGVSQAASRLPSLRTDPIPQARRQTYNRHALSSPLPEINDSIASVSFMPSSPPIRFAAHTPPRRHNTKSPSAPPAIQQVEMSPSKAETPKLVNVVKAGIALQGVVNGNNRGTQDRRPSDDFREEAQRARLDDMFSDFGSGTKRELQAGLRLGQQLAERARSRPTTRESTQDPSREASVERPATRGSSAASDGEVFDGPSVSGTSHQDSSHHRLPTPDDEDYALASPPPPPSQLFAQQPDFAANPAQTQLISPARSQASPNAEEMQDGAKTPPSTEEEDGDEPQSYQDSELRREPGEDFDVYWQRRRETISRKIDEAGSSQVIVLSSDRSESSQLSVESSQNALDGDIWEEEGSRNSNTRSARRREKRGAAKRSGEKSGESAGSASSRRRNPNGSSLRNQSESGGGRENSRSSGTRAGSSRSANREGAQGRPRSSRTERSSSEESSESALTPDSGSEVEKTEDTGLFWHRSSQSPQPEPPHLESNKLDLSMLMAINDSPAKEPVLATPPKLHPSKTPYNLGAGLKSSPVKGSPLKQQIMFSSPSAVNSSPYHRIEHTIASSVLQDGDTMAIDEDSMSSDTTQLRQDVATRPLSGRTRVIPPSPAVFGPEDLEVQRQIENELTPRTSRMKTLNLGGNNRRRLFDDNSDPTLESEPSIQVEQSSYLSNRSSERSTHRSRDSQVEQTYVEEEQPADLSLNESRSNMTTLNVNKERRPLFEQKARMPLFEQQKPIGSVAAPPVQLIAKHAPQQAPQPEVQHSGGLFGRLWTAMGSSTEPVAPQVPLHPLALRYNNLPKIAPWTKTHWDTLDRIYQRYKRHPEQFSPQDPPNKTLLAQKYQWQPGSSKTESVSYYTNVKMQNWNYTVKITSELLVCCAIFMQLLTLKDAAEYRRATGKDIVRGNFMQKDRTGDPITLRDVIARMFGVVGGEMIRADEKRGICVRRDLDQLKFSYPWVPGWWDEMGRYLHD